MKIVSQSLRLALDYLSKFGQESDVLLFRPLGDEVVISLNGKAYGEYRCRTDAPLGNRFAVPLRIPGRLVRELPDDLLIQFAVGSHLKLSVDRNEFRSPLADLESLGEHPSVSEGITFEWDSAVFVPEVKAAAACTASKHKISAAESIHIEVLPARETIVATDTKLLTIYEKKANNRNGGRRGDEVEARALIHRQNVPQLLATCESAAKVSLRFGHSQVLVTGGRRKSIIPIQEGAFPEWRKQIAGVLASHAVIKSRIDVDAAVLAHGIRQVKADALAKGGDVSGSVLLFARDRELTITADSDQGTSQAVVRLSRRGR